MATWNTDNPALANSIGADIPDIEENLQELHDVIETITDQTLGTDEPATFHTNSILSDGTGGRVLRAVKLQITYEDATKSSYELVSMWNGDAEADTPLAKSGTSGNYSLSASGAILTVAAAAFSGNLVFATGIVAQNHTGDAVMADVYAQGNDLLVNLTQNVSGGGAWDATTLIASGELLNINILYITSA